MNDSASAGDLQRVRNVSWLRTVIGIRTIAGKLEMLPKRGLFPWLAWKVSNIDQPATVHADRIRKKVRREESSSAIFEKNTSAIEPSDHEDAL